MPFSDSLAMTGVVDSTLIQGEKVMKKGQRKASEARCPSPATIIIIELDAEHEFHDEEWTEEI
jgi:hypothetical protein